MYRVIGNIYKSYYTNAKYKLRKSTMLLTNPKEKKYGVNFTNL